MKGNRLQTMCGALLLALLAADAGRADWRRFRGPQGSGVSTQPHALPTTWTRDQNLKWKRALPGPGGSSPIVVGDRIFVTCWSGYATGRDGESIENLKRHLVCVDQAGGDLLWTRTVDAVLPEDEYQGMFAENGYASHTPVSDGRHVFAFFGKSGVHAYDLNGEKQWSADVGTDRDFHGWGSASSPIVYENLLIVPAAVESHALVALDTETGQVVWRQEAEGFGGTWGTPLVVTHEGQDHLVLGVPFEVWGFNPRTGKLRWYCESVSTNSMCSSVVAHQGLLFAMESGPGGGGAVAIRIGGEGDVSDQNIEWTTRDRSRIGTPLVYDGRIYWISNKIAHCVDAATGRRVYQERLGAGRRATPGRAGGPFRGRRGGPGGQDYASPVAGDGKLYYVTRAGTAYVIQLGPEFKLLATNQLADGSDFSATPAISDGQILIRSNSHLYCLADTSGGEPQP